MCSLDLALGEGERSLSEAITHHLARVLRLDRGARLVLFDGRGREQDATLTELVASKRSLSATVTLEGAPRDGVIADRARVHVLQGSAKGDKLERVVRACAELGAVAVWPVQCERSVARPDAARAEAQRAHLAAVSASASEQCGRADLLDVEPLRTLSVALERARVVGLVGCVADESGGEPVRRWIERSAARSAPLAVLVGPEGGLSDEERRIAVEAGFDRVSFGRRILRTEHAAAAFVAVASALVGDGSRTGE